jgi:hypothetical protein
MNKTWILMAIVVLVLLPLSTLPACTSESDSTPTVSPTPKPQIATPTPAEGSRAGLPLPTVRGDLFVASGVCAVCHTKMVDAAGADVSIDTFWRATMMANAARDPYWQAALRKEVMAHPDHRQAIEEKCATCHTSMARYTAKVTDKPGLVLDEGFVYPEHPLHTLALDGVSCTLCHQITEAKLGTDESYSGGYDIDTELPMGERLSFGPYAVDQTQITVMQSASGFIPEKSTHVQQSELCASCHVLYTSYFDAEGEIAGEFPEQTPYLEWLYSDYRDQQSCQDCHMPKAEGEVLISITGGVPRAPVRKHNFVGGNAYVLSLFKLFGPDLDVTASSEHFNATIDRVTDQLRNRTATVSLTDVQVSDARLTAKVVIENLTGHKFPTGYPSRRTWLHFTVRDGAGEIVFESGAAKADGAIIGNDNDDDPAQYEPHYLTIDSTDQVQIYEAIMGNTENEVTTTLLRGASYLKDNRLLPQGFETDDQDVAVNGQATQDSDFQNGDTVQYDIALDQAEGPFTVTVDLLYQAISYRWAENLREHPAPETDRFLKYRESLPDLITKVASATVQVE